MEFSPTSHAKDRNPPHCLKREGRVLLSYHLRDLVWCGVSRVRLRTQLDTLGSLRYQPVYSSTGYDVPLRTYSGRPSRKQYATRSNPARTSTAFLVADAAPLD